MSEPLRARKVNGLTQKVWPALRKVLPITAMVVATLVAFVVLAGASARAGLGCTACHTMLPYERAADSSAHPGLGCEACHTGTGALGVVGDGLAATRMLLAEPFVDRADPGSVFSNGACVGCHDAVGRETVISRGLAVRHSDFMDVACTTCHAGTGHALAQRHYRGPEMEDCTRCHTVSVTNLESCETCHRADEDQDRREGATAWRATHGPGWETAHGMGDLTSCTTCHAGDFCVTCHGVKLPHGAEWPREHGRDLEPVTREACATCHEPAWCEGCHGVEMPHPGGFMAEHEFVSADVGEQTCVNCHNKEYCNACHLASSHPDLPGVGMVHVP